VIFLGGCVSIPDSLEVARSPFEVATEKRKGTILVKPFVDNRKGSHQGIGALKDSGFLGIPPYPILHRYEVQEGLTVDGILTGFFVDALRHAGYEAELQNPNNSQLVGGDKFNAILEGEINEFWFEVVFNTSVEVNVDLKLLDKNGKEIVWEDNVEESRKELIWVRSDANIKRAIREALDNALALAIEKFTSEEFNLIVNSDN
jgi:hypothetical protein